MQYNVIIVGAGSSEAVLATRLSEEPQRSVLLLKASADYPDLASLSAALAMVDQYGRVYGLAGLHVVDTSLLPDCPRANTNVVIMMRGERIAARIRQEL
jgi:choline dehydrogenase-like flavoprotein